MSTFQLTCSVAVLSSVKIISASIFGKLVGICFVSISVYQFPLFPPLSVVFTSASIKGLFGAIDVIVLYEPRNTPAKSTHWLQGWVVPQLYPSSPIQSTYSSPG